MSKARDREQRDRIVAGLKRPPAAPVTAGREQDATLPCCGQVASLHWNDADDGHWTCPPALPIAGREQDARETLREQRDLRDAAAEMLAAWDVANLVGPVHLPPSVARAAERLRAALLPSPPATTGALAAFPDRPVTRCCDLHRDPCCDPDDCGPCCQNCPTCPALHTPSSEEWEPLAAGDYPRGWAHSTVTDGDAAAMWAFGDESAALSIARAAWPFDMQVAEWAPRMVTDRDLYERTVAAAGERLRSASAAVLAALAVGATETGTPGPAAGGGDDD